MRLTCPNCRSKSEIDDALIPVRAKELECSDREHARRESAALRTAQGSGARP